MTVPATLPARRRDRPADARKLPAAQDGARLPAEVAALMALKVWGYKEGEVVSLMIDLGDRLGVRTGRWTVPAR